MALFRVTDPDSGRTLTLEGESPPTEQELEQVFAGGREESKPATELPPISPTPYEQAYMQSVRQGVPTLDPSGMRSTDLVATAAPLLNHAAEIASAPLHWLGDRVLDVANVPTEISTKLKAREMGLEGFTNEELRQQFPGVLPEPLTPESITPKIPRIPEMPDAPGVVQAAGGAGNVAINLANEMLPPFAPPDVGLMLPATMVGGVPGRVVAAGFGVPTALSVPGAVVEAGRALDDPNLSTAQKTEAALNPVAQAAFATLMLRHAAKPTIQPEGVYAPETRVEQAGRVGEYPGTETVGPQPSAVRGDSVVRGAEGEGLPQVKPQEVTTKTGEISSKLVDEPTPETVTETVTEPVAAPSDAVRYQELVSIMRDPAATAEAKSAAWAELEAVKNKHDGKPPVGQNENKPQITNEPKSTTTNEGARELESINRPPDKFESGDSGQPAVGTVGDIARPESSPAKVVELLAGTAREQAVPSTDRRTPQIVERINNRDKRDWSKLPRQFELDAVRAAFNDTKELFPKAAISQRVKASKATTFSELRQAVAESIEKYPIESKPKESAPAGGEQKPSATPTEPIKYSFSEGEIQVGKPRTQRKKRENGDDITTSVEINAPLDVTRPENWSSIDPNNIRYTVEARGVFEERRPPKKSENVWRVWNPKTQSFIASGLNYDAAVSAAKRAMIESNFGKESKPTESQPGIISGTQLESWANERITEGKKRLNVGLDPELLTAYAVKGAAVLERGVRDFAKWSAEMISRHGDEVKPYLKTIYDEATAVLAEPQRYQIEGGKLKMRQSAERATTAEMVPTAVQEQIKTAPESFYEQQSVPRVEEAVAAMPDIELASVPKTSNIYVAAALERAKRLFDSGKNDEGYGVFVELEKEGTRMGQLINQFKLLKGTRPETVVSIINNTLNKNKRDPLTPVQAEKAITITKESKAADSALDKATAAWEKNPTPENAKAAEAALDKANAEAVNLQKFVGQFQKKTIAGTLKAALQGNLLTPMSQTANIVGNISFLPFRAGARSVATALDILDNAIRGNGRTTSVDPVSGTVEAAKGLAEGAKKIPEILRRGKGDVIKGERTQGLQPIRAWINQFAKNPEMPTTGGKLTLSDRVRLAIEGTFGVPAEAMLRLLSAGDAPFSEAARGRVIAEQLRLKNVPKNQWSFARKFPELFFDKDTMSQIHQDAAAAVFQRESGTLNLITQWIRNKGDIFDLAVATVAPYKLTPWNIIGEIMSYNPAIAFAKTVFDAKKGNSRAAKLNAGKFVVGSMLTTGGWWLYKNGLISPSLDSKDEANKARVLSQEIMPPNHINLSGLKRALSGGSPEFKAGDETVDIFKAGGLAGAIFYMTANIGRQFENMPKEDSDEMWKAIVSQSTLEQARFGLNQSFLSGVEGLLSAIKDGNSENYVRQWMNTVASVPLPNSLAALSRATREFKPDFNDAEFSKKAENIVRNRLGFAGLDDYAPLKIDLWGRPVRETPEGRNSIIYQFFDITKNREVSSDPIDIELYRLWRRTNNSRVIPSIPEKALTVGGKTYGLDVPQRSRLAELTGKRRREIVENMVINPEWQKVPDDIKIRLLERAYDSGRDVAKAVLFKETQGQLTEKPQKAGFK